MSSLNFLKGLSFDRTAQTSFWQKLADTFEVFFGDLNLYNDPKNGTKEHWGVFDYSTLFVSCGIEALRKWLTKDKDEAKVALFYLFLILYVPLTIIRFFFSLAFTIIFTPVVGVVHFSTQPVIPGQTPIWKSFLLHPSTWFALAIITLGIGFLIYGVGDSLIFAQALLPLAVIAPIFLGIGALATLGMIAYLTCRLFFTNSMSAEEVAEKIIEQRENTIDSSSTQQKEIKHSNFVAGYFSEWSEWMAEYKITGHLIWGIGLSLMLVAITLTAMYCTGGILPDTFVGHLFDFMNHVFSECFKALAHLPGLEALSSISAESLAMISQTLSAVTMTAGILMVTSLCSRLAETVKRVPKAEVTYEEFELPLMAVEEIGTNRSQPGVKIGDRLCVVRDGTLFRVSERPYLGGKDISAQPATQKDFLGPLKNN